MLLSTFRAALPRLIFAGALASLSLVAVFMPAWAEALKAQGYYTDFSLQLGAQPHQVLAGASAVITYDVASLGPDAAQAPALVLREDAGLAFLDNAGCTRLSDSSLRCALPPMQPGQVLPRGGLLINTDPDARGLRLVSGYVTAETRPSADGPGIKVDATWMELRGEFDVGLAGLSAPPVQLADGYLRWTLVLDNAGPSSVIDGHFEMAANAQFRAACRSVNGAVCPQAAAGAVYLPPNSRLEFDLDVPAGTLDSSDISLFAAFTALEGSPIGSRPRFVSAVHGRALFENGFDP